MLDKVQEYIEKFKNKNGRLDCGVAFKIADKLQVDVALVGDTATQMGVKIDACELGQFGKLPLEFGSVMAYKNLQPMLDEKCRITCKDARDAAKGVGMKKIRSTLRDYNIDVKYCQLGCFKEKKGKKMIVKTKTWIENSEGELLFGKGKTEVLEVIAESGSIVKAAEILGMNYKKCWTHLQILAKNLDEDLVNTKQGGGGSAGTTLNPRAYELINAYKQLQRDIEDYANNRFKELFLNDQKDRVSKK
ncbi:LysR family transcriptional regulator [Campylobacter sp. RM9344]|uniref:LysR family transcriptional regulator n=1 Tax=Campylobacter californiensis TaxID=1032243 RepID=A0AAW3ZUA1_9BACT|nr:MULTISPECIES: LysR family transcriptional regulator [unclassified Campylobacter]MBE2984124.1 LysR family transcriptional regulator [Campylobacter sp. RM6883]MBE2986252.1 LysR family transcriptional regulator [Campylobacter sp. RM12919]MBE2988249.1 LysR family transcriptional regulator [Campylobacter sp. RM12920]MBE2995786.1 LysR family transcriptional regulator [Campylobacter sp. RM6913]MBE3021909.1 LysR family transcriptional regulator [Campylobacter sp. 7477a]MBE3030168.1 LysR family tra